MSNCTGAADQLAHLFVRLRETRVIYLQVDGQFPAQMRLAHFEWGRTVRNNGQDRQQSDEINGQSELQVGVACRQL